MHEPADLRLEGVCAALGVAMEPDDQIFSTYRSLGDAIAKGADLRRIIAELYGRSGGACGGKGGPMHLHDTGVGFMTSTGVVGSGIPIAVGLGIAAQLDGAQRAVVTTFGDGATSIGAFHESMNMAGLWKLPVVFLCQNNQWGEHTPIAEYAASTDLAGRAAGYAMPAVKVDGFDPAATYEVLREACERARSGGGPTFVEAITYRLPGHTGSADYSYVPAEELAAAMERDPAPTFRRSLLASGAATEEDLAFSEKGEVPVGMHLVPLGVADIRRAGEDVSVITYVTQVRNAMAAAATLADDGVSVEVIDLRTLVPLDMATVRVEEYRAVMDVNLLGSILMTRHFFDPWPPATGERWSTSPRCRPSPPCPVPGSTR